MMAFENRHDLEEEACTLETPSVFGFDAVMCQLC